MKRHVFLRTTTRCALVFFLLAAVVHAQRRGQSSQTGQASDAAAGSSSNRSMGSRSSDAGPGPSSRPSLPSERASGILLSGRVVMEDGAVPPEPVVIERVCNGVGRPEGYTDSKGRFSIELGRNARTVTDASTGSSERYGASGSSSSPRAGAGRSTAYSGCELRASLPGYRSDVVMLNGRGRVDTPDVGVIVLHRRKNVEGATISLTNLKAPKEAQKALEKGRKALSKQQWQQAQKELEKAVRTYPQYAAAWFELGRVLEQQGKMDEARNAYSKAVEADAKFVNPYLELANLAATEQLWQEVVDTTDCVVRLNPVDFPIAFFLNSLAHLNLKHFDAAEKSAWEALRLDQEHRIPRIDYLLGFILAQKGDFPGAAQHMKSYLDLVPNANDAETVKKQLAEVERLAANRPPQ